MFAAIPVLALSVVAIVGLIWLRQPVDAKQELNSTSETVASALARLEEVSRRVESLTHSVPAPAKRKTATAQRAKAS